MGNSAHPTLTRALGLKPKIEALNSAVAGQFVQRAQIAMAFWLAVIADRASFLYGPPGVAKTAVTSFLSKLVQGMIFYEELMPVVVSPEQLIVSETALTERQNADGSKAIQVSNKIGLAAAAHLVALDEIWKAQPAVLKVLFDLLLADGVRMGGQFYETPTLGVLAASNELPEEGNQLEALWARMAFRFNVQSLDRAGKMQMLQKRRYQDQNGKTAPVQPLTLDDLHTLQEARRFVEVPDDIFGCVLDIYEQLLQQDAVGFQWLWDDDRRLDMVREGLQAHALMHGRAVVTKVDLVVLEYMLWNTLEQIGTIKAVLAPFVRTPAGEAQEFVDALMAPGGIVDGYLNNAHEKSTDALRQCRETMVALEELAKVAGPDAPAVRTLIDNVKATAGAVAKKAAGL